MIWILLLLSATAAPVAAGLIMIVHVKAQQRPLVLKREDLGFGGDWK
jgi:membrane protein CcdC involved in cytochrome C biogenesis